MHGIAIMTPPFSLQSESLDDEAIDWVVLLHSGHAGAGDLQRLVNWRAMSPAHELAYQRACALWDDTGRAALRIQPVPLITKRESVGRGAFAALAAALFMAVGAAMHQWHWDDVWLSDYHTATGERREIVLADNSRVLLNTDSAIELDWTAEVRRIRLLHGQALFQVAPDRVRPFEVVTESGTVRALGTIFDVYEHGGEACVTVQEHAVAVYRPKQSMIRVDAGQRLHLGGADAAPKAMDLTESAAWQRGKLIFRDRPLAEVIDELNRYRRGRIVITDGELNALRVTGVFGLDDPDTVLDDIKQSLSLADTRLSPWLALLHR